MTKEQKEEIIKICKGFARGLGMPLNGSGWLVVDPMSGFLNASGFENTLEQIPANDKHPQVLIMRFNDGAKLVPAGKDLRRVYKEFKNWHWIE